MKKILVIGSKGQLGNEFQKLAASFIDYEFVFHDKEELDIVDRQAVLDNVAEIQPDYLINCAAYTAVDKAETDSALCYAINADAVGYLAEACTKTGARFVHISTDYVFDGTASEPYTEESKVNPVSVYGDTKLKGELNASEINPEVIIIRTAWVYSTFGNNFVKTMLRLMSTRPEINVVADQKGTPTYAADLAEAIMKIISTGQWEPGIYHFTNEGVITWFDFATEIKHLSNSPCLVHPITTDQYPTPAKRPQYSVLDKTKIQKTFHIQLRDWRESLQRCIASMPKD